MRTIALLAASVLFAGCAASGAKDQAESKETTPLQLWSHHKWLELPVAACAEKGFKALTESGFSNIVRNGDYSYGNYQESRAAVKCVEMPKGSFVYFAVASTTKDAAEELRNRISAKM